MYCFKRIFLTLLISGMFLPQLATASQLFQPFIEKLKKEGCIIPTPPKAVAGFPSYTYTYTISGEFAHVGQEDLAVLCDMGNKRYIRIKWGGEFRCNSTIEASFGDSIEAVGKPYILIHYESYGGEVPPEIRHKGINDIFLGKASVVHYCHKSTWLELTGAD